MTDTRSPSPARAAWARAHCDARIWKKGCPSISRPCDSVCPSASLSSVFPLECFTFCDFVLRRDEVTLKTERANQTSVIGEPLSFVADDSRFDERCIWTEIVSVIFHAIRGRRLGSCPKALTKPILVYFALLPSAALILLF